MTAAREPKVNTARITECLDRAMSCLAAASAALPGSTYADTLIAQANSYVALSDAYRRLAVPVRAPLRIMQAGLDVNGLPDYANVDIAD